MNPLIELRDIRFGYGARPVLDGINLHLHPGQFAALVGPSGAGKTTLLKLILRLLRPTSGQVFQRETPPLRLAYVPQLETVDWNFPVTAEEVVLMGIARQSGRWPWPRAAERRRARDILAQLEIADLAQRHIRDLSGGQQQRVFLARALIAGPEVLVLDEPTNGVDMRSAENIFHQLAHLNQDGMTILITTHDLNMAAAHAPWVVCLNQTIIDQGSPERVFTEVILSQTYRGEMLVIRQNGLIFVQQKPHG
ncbi:MAG: metal ABC transporter ATP-binding protein, partial [Chloroflexi bacterium]|nr:metal ABC transporter ATP-binding protein [Chloroflexota bacterium]